MGRAGKDPTAQRPELTPSTSVRHCWDPFQVKATRTQSRKEECGQESRTAKWQTLQTEQNQTCSQAPEGLINMLSRPSGQQAAPWFCDMTWRESLGFGTFGWFQHPQFSMCSTTSAQGGRSQDFPAFGSFLPSGS